jgi:hypothetical protein
MATYESIAEAQAATGEDDAGGGIGVFSIESPHVTVGWGPVGYEDGSNALFFVAETPVTTAAFAFTNS